ncbi:hypothetical protein ON010_g7626 [Phytophthora cinnamomi]|nr:hypothetical protein ON010_g7626 [Phytophthora cinnamomi]
MPLPLKIARPLAKNQAAAQRDDAGSDDGAVPHVRPGGRHGRTRQGVQGPQGPRHQPPAGQQGAAGGRRATLATAISSSSDAFISFSLCDSMAATTDRLQPGRVVPLLRQRHLHQQGADQGAPRVGRDAHHVPPLHQHHPRLCGADVPELADEHGGLAHAARAHAQHHVDRAAQSLLRVRQDAHVLELQRRAGVHHADLQGVAAPVQRGAGLRGLPLEVLLGHVFQSRPDRLWCRHGLRVRDGNERPGPLRRDVRCDLSAAGCHAEHVRQVPAATPDRSRHCQPALLQRVRVVRNQCAVRANERSCAPGQFCREFPFRQGADVQHDALHRQLLLVLGAGRGIGAHVLHHEHDEARGRHPQRCAVLRQPRHHPVGPGHGTCDRRSCFLSASQDLGEAVQNAAVAANGKIVRFMEKEAVKVRGVSIKNDAGTLCQRTVPTEDKVQTNEREKAKSSPVY